MTADQIHKIRSFNRFYTSLLGVLDRHMYDAPYTLPEARVLFEIDRNELGTASTIVASLGIDKGYLSRILKGFEKSGLIKKSTIENDRRNYALSLSQKGKKELQKLNELSESHVKKVFGNKNQQQLDMLLHGMAGIQNQFSAAGNSLTVSDISIRTYLKPGDMGYLIHRHGEIYSQEHGFGLGFENYVAKGVSEFYENYDPDRDRVWICEHETKRVGYLFLMHRPNNTAQLRYFYLEKEFRGLGLGNKLMTLFIEFYKAQGYTSSYLLTTDGLDPAAHLYEKFGYELIEEYQTDFFGVNLMERRYELAH